MGRLYGKEQDAGKAVLRGFVAKHTTRLHQQRGIGKFGRFSGYP
ncbi:hypothetical protein HMPREF9123_0757 [Neisseria bacilliformis ATCC BAA-1200]|uniref:Uncharacterized protein n=1 Tax=Neisseria bacilliformis ATCC BAA-1200 TaxID=888742 RepID=F2BAM6_9NEIS|nr:hypothetical protein HMPREF9123_0757 [Neisseria bacilliformis ATCC BAA-1200]